MTDRFEVYLRCPCGHEAMLLVPEYPERRTFRCTACQRSDPEVAIWPTWQRPMRREGWSPWPKG